jgi:hypothetical protein
MSKYTDIMNANIVRTSGQFNRLRTPASTTDLSGKRRKPKLTRRSRDLSTRDWRTRAAVIRDTLNAVDYLCSGTVLEHLTRCGKPGCRCSEDLTAGHGPYYDWGHMLGGKLVHRRVSPEQAVVLRHAIANYRKVKKLLLAWEKESERLIDAELPRNS